MDISTLQEIIKLRTELIQKFNRLRDYKNNKNAIMKEADHARLIHETIKRLDGLLGDHVSFAETKSKK